MRCIVTLTTDFGTRDAYVAQMKGVLYALGPRELEVVDLTHEIAPQQVLEAALFVHAAWPRFPPGTVHIVVVDPGVGSARRGLACRHGGQAWVGPDNGVLTLLLDHATPAVALQPERFALQPVSATFHGRDVFAPAAAQLARGAALAALGAPASDLVRLAWPQPHVSSSELQGQVVHVDRFGNLISNISRATLAGWLALEAWSQPRVRAGAGPWLALSRCYADAAVGSPVALLGSGDWLEVAVTNGDAARQLGLGVGASVCVRTAAELAQG